MAGPPVDSPFEVNPNKFKALALQHKTDSYVCCLSDKPTEVCYVQKDEVEMKRFFKQAVHDVVILTGAKYTVISLQSEVQVYSRNGKDLFDIVECELPSFTSAQILDHNE